VNNDTRLFVFEFSGKTFAVPLACVEEVIEFYNVEQYSGVVPHCTGTVNHRGRILPIFDPCGLSFKKDTQGSKRAYIVILKIDDVILGLVIERHLELLALNNTQADDLDCETVPATDDGDEDSYSMLGYHDRAMTFLSPKLLAPLVRKHFGNQSVVNYAGDQDNKRYEKNTEEFIISKIGETLVAHPVGSVMEIVEGLDVMPLFRTDPCLRGLTSLRGRVLSCIDISEVLGLPERALDDHSVFLVLSNKEAEFVLCIDNVVGIRSFAPEIFQITEGLLPMAVKELFDGVAEKDHHSYLRLQASAIVEWGRLAPFRKTGSDRLG